MTQKERIYHYLKDGGVLNRLNAWEELGILEAPARISELRSEGVPIETKRIKVHNRYNESVIIAEWSICDRGDS